MFAVKKILYKVNIRENITNAHIFYELYSKFNKRNVETEIFYKLQKFKLRKGRFSQFINRFVYKGVISLP